jgi:DNA-directed RNA polymerase subunit M/transcription elongation factor TFIIS
LPLVFGCPNCENPFQVPEDAAGQTFACPSCEATIEIPSTLNSVTASEHSQSRNDVEVFECPFCSGQFGVDSDAPSETLKCPHCNEQVAVEEPTEQPEPVSELKLKELPEVKEISGLATLGKKKQRGEIATDSSLERDGKSTDANEFRPKPVDHLLPPRFDVPDPVRFPTRIGSDEVILPDGDGGYRAVEANIVTMVHDGQVYRLKKMTPEQRQRRKLIHSVVTILIAIVLIYLTLRTIGLIT